MNIIFLLEKLCDLIFRGRIQNLSIACTYCFRVFLIRSGFLVCEDEMCVEILCVHMVCTT